MPVCPSCGARINRSREVLRRQVMEPELPKTICGYWGTIIGAGLFLGVLLAVPSYLLGVAITQFVWKEDSIGLSLFGLLALLFAGCALPYPKLGIGKKFQFIGIYLFSYLVSLRHRVCVPVKYE